ncbi:kinase-like protein [Atractiella rhizophila]|nr:kinase-like protein [Atractiella rhizophila]
MPPRSTSPMAAYRSKRDSTRKRVLDRYTIMGFISSGTYGRVYKAREMESGEDKTLVAIKKFKPDSSKEGEVANYTGLSQSAIREIMLNRELSHINVTTLREVLLEDKSIYMVFDYAEHDFLQIIHHHSTQRTHLPLGTLKSLLWQLANGIAYLHDNWVMHRDLKPANILVNASGVVKIGDLGLARMHQAPLQSLYNSDKLVVTIWYRSPDLLLGAKHYTNSIDMWSMGCIMGELVGLRPMFKGEEAKLEPVHHGKHNKHHSTLPFQKDQLTKIFEILGVPSKSRWPSIVNLPEYDTMLKTFDSSKYTNQLYGWYNSRQPRPSQASFDFLSNLLAYDPTKRLTAKEALYHKWWSEEPKPLMK